MTAPTPLEVLNLVAEVRRRGIDVADAYRWAHGTAFSGRVYENVKVKLQAISPTESIGASAPSFHLEQVFELLLDVNSELKAAEARLLRVLDAYDPPQTRDIIEVARGTTRDDVERSREAQRRRIIRDDHIPA